MDSFCDVDSSEERNKTMTRVLITTVGTSLLTNRDRPWGGWNARAGHPLPDQNTVQQWLESADLIAASAETNTLQALGLEESDRLVLLHSDTPEGRFCSQQLAVFYRRRCAEVTERQITALGYEHESFAQRGLRSLVSVAITEVREAKRQAHQPVFCATGGFKAEIAFLNLLGALLSVEVYYIHEQFREVVRLPRLPLAWNVDELLEEHRDFFEWIDAEPRPSNEVENWLKGRPDLRPLVEDASDGHTYLNAAGNMIYQAALAKAEDRPRAKWPESVSLSPDEKNRVSSVGHHRPKGWEQFVRRLCEIDCVTSIMYDDAGFSGPLVKIVDAQSGTLAVRFEAAGQTLPLRVETTARGEAQTELVAEYLRRRVVR